MSLLPTIVIMLLIVGGMRHFHLLNNLDFYHVDDPQQLGVLYDAGTTNVEMRFQKLTYMGYDYEIDGERVGGYYYVWVNGKFMVVLLDSDETIICDYLVQGQLKKDPAAYNYILSECAESVGIEQQHLETITYDYLISEVDYPKTFYMIVKAALIIAFAVIILSIIEGIVYWFYPWKHPQIRQMKGYRDKKLLTGDINRQLHDALVYETGNCYVTRKYLVIWTPFRTDIIVLRDIDVVSRHKETKKILPWMPPRDVYKLIISNANGAIFEHDFHDEKILDTILPYIQKKKRDR